MGVYVGGQAKHYLPESPMGGVAGERSVVCEGNRIHCIANGESEIVRNPLKSRCYNQAFLCSCVDYSIKWATKTYPMASLTPTCKPVKSRGALVPALSPDGRLLAVALNQRDPRVSPRPRDSVVSNLIPT